MAAAKAFGKATGQAGGALCTRKAGDCFCGRIPRLFCIRYVISALRHPRANALSLFAHKADLAHIVTAGNGSWQIHPQRSMLQLLPNGHDQQIFYLCLISYRHFIIPCFQLFVSSLLSIIIAGITRQHIILHRSVSTLPVSIIFVTSRK